MKIMNHCFVGLLLLCGASAAYAESCTPTAAQIAEQRKRSDNDLIDSYKHLQYDMSLPCWFHAVVKQVRDERIQTQSKTLVQETDEDLKGFIHRCTYTAEYRKEGEEHILCAAADVEGERRSKLANTQETPEGAEYKQMVDVFMKMSPLSFQKDETFHEACGPGVSATHKMDLRERMGGNDKCAAYAEAKKRRSSK